MKHIKRFDIYWANFDPVKGKEIKKARPCVVVSPDVMNDALGTVIVVPLTSTIVDWPFRVTITSTKKKSSAACDQLRAVTKERLNKKVGTVTAKEQRAMIAVLSAIFAE